MCHEDTYCIYIRFPSGFPTSYIPHFALPLGTLFGSLIEFHSLINRHIFSIFKYKMILLKKDVSIIEKQNRIS